MHAPLAHSAHVGSYVPPLLIAPAHARLVVHAPRVLPVAVQGAVPGRPLPVAVPAGTFVTPFTIRIVRLFSPYVSMA